MRLKDLAEVEEDTWTRRKEEGTEGETQEDKHSVMAWFLVMTMFRVCPWKPVAEGGGRGRSQR
jgi:hypothetical protein